jgi:hypothetical protein
VSPPGAPAADTGRLGAGAALLLYAALTPLLTWPLVAASGEALALRGDYALNLWNFWWVAQVFSPDGAVALYWTDALHHPIGVSLARHELSPLNAGMGALLSSFADPQDAFRWLVAIHFWLSAWTFFLFARAVTGSAIGAFLAGLFYSFGPFHFYYLAQLNAVTLEFLPLAAWWLVRSYREGGVRNALGVALSAALLAGSSSYYVVYAALLGAALLAGGRLWSPETPWRTGAARLALAGGAAAAAVALAAMPLLLAGSSSPLDPHAVMAARQETLLRSNDLLGFLWIGPPESAIVSWPSMLGWSTLALAAIGVRRERRWVFWLGLALAFALLSLGPMLRIAGRGTGLPLPYRLFSELPVLWMLRKPDRMFALVQLPVGVLLAFGWQSLSGRIGAPGARLAVAAACAAVLVLERLAVPLETYPVVDAPYLQRLAHEPEVRAVVHLPHEGGMPADGRANLLQTRHGKPIAQGYVVNLALEPQHRALASEWAGAYERLAAGDGEPVAAIAGRDGIDRVFLHKWVPRVREPRFTAREIVWAPFALAARDLVPIRQLGHLEEEAVPATLLSTQKLALARRFGDPVYEDDELVVYAIEGVTLVDPRP